MIISRTPLRVSLLGGGTDVRDFFYEHNGAVLSMPINKYVYACLNPSFDGHFRISYSKTERVEEIDEIEHDIVRAALQQYPQMAHQGLEVVTVADVPGNGTGLGSSSALACGLIEALDYMQNGMHSLTLHGVARAAVNIEVDILKKPIGEQDQFGTAIGRLKLIEFRKVSTFATRYTIENGNELAKCVRLYWAGQRGRNSLIEQNAPENVKANTSMLCDLRDIALEGAQLASERRYSEIGILMRSSWNIKQKLAKGISNPSIDTLIDRALHGDAWGAKMCGAGGGGFLAVMCDPELELDMGLEEMKFDIDQEGTQVIHG